VELEGDSLLWSFIGSRAGKARNMAMGRLGCDPFRLDIAAIACTVSTRSKNGSSKAPFAGVSNRMVDSLSVNQRCAADTNSFRSKLGEGGRFSYFLAFIIFTNSITHSLHGG